MARPTPSQASGARTGRGATTPQAADPKFAWPATRDRARHVGQAARRSRKGHRPREVHVRHQSSGHALRAHRPLAASARARRLGRSVCGASARRASRPRSCGAIRRRRPNNRVMFQGDEVAAVAADTEEHAIDAARLIKVEYEVLPHVTVVEQALAGNGAGRSSPTATCVRGRRRRPAISRPASRRRRTPSRRPTRRTSSRTPAWSRTARCASGTATS